MFDFAWSEMALIGVVALVVIGPKDLPRVLRTAGVMVRRARGMAREFQNSIDDMIREAELDEFRNQVNETRRSLEESAHVDLNADPAPLDSGRMQPALGVPAPEPQEEQLDLGLDQPRQPESQHLHYAGYNDPHNRREASETALPFDYSEPVMTPLPHHAGTGFPPEIPAPSPLQSPPPLSPPSPPKQTDFHPPAP